MAELLAKADRPDLLAAAHAAACARHRGIRPLTRDAAPIRILAPTWTPTRS